MEKHDNYSKLMNRRFFAILMISFLSIFVIISVFYSISVPECVSEPQEKPTRNTSSYIRPMPPELNKEIVEVMKMTKTYVRDINDDDEVNCIDYACTFKMCWDRKFPQRRLECCIVRNYNKETGFHHLFIRIYSRDKLVFVESRASNPYKYTMDDNWTKGKYNPKYNIFGETYEWLDRVEPIWR